MAARRRTNLQQKRDEEKAAWFAMLDSIGAEGSEVLWSMVRRLAKADTKRALAKVAGQVNKLDVTGVPGEQVLADVLAILEAAGSGKRWRNPATRQTRLAPGQQWTVELGTVNGRVRRADYRRYMQSPEWQAKRLWWWKEAGRPTRCAACPAPWSLERGDLHHRSYDRLGYERFEDLVQLCTRCHQIVHANIKSWSHLERDTDLVIAQLRRRHGELV